MGYISLIVPTQCRFPERIPELGISINNINYKYRKGGPFIRLKVFSENVIDICNRFNISPAEISTFLIGKTITETRVSGMMLKITKEIERIGYREFELEKI